MSWKVGDRVQVTENFSTGGYQVVSGVVTAYRRDVLRGEEIELDGFFTMELFPDTVVTVVKPSGRTLTPGMKLRLVKTGNEYQVIDVLATGSPTHWVDEKGNAFPILPVDERNFLDPSQYEEVAAPSGKAEGGVGS